MSRRVVILGLLVLAVGGWLALRELPRVRDAEERAAAEARVFGPLPSAIDTVRVRQSEREILLVRDGETWWLRSPIDEEVPRIGVENLVARLVETRRWRRVAHSVPDGEWELYGLGETSPSRVRIDLGGPDGRASIDVGELTAGSRTVWVRRVGSEELWLCLEDLYDIANMTHQGLRDPRLFEVDHSEIVRLDFETGSRGWTAVRDERGLWFAGSTSGERLKRWVVEEYAFTTAGMRAAGYLRDDLAEADWAAYGLDRPWGSVRWEADDGRSGTVWFGNEVDDGIVFGRRTGLQSVFQIAPEIANALEADPARLVDRNPVVGNFLRSTKLRVHAGDGYVDVLRETPGVELVSDHGPVEAGDYSQVAGRNLQRGLEELQPLAEMIVPAGSDPVGLLDPVEGRVTIVWPDREVDVVLGQRAGEAWMAVPGEAALWQIDRGMLLRLREVQELR